MEQSYTHQYLTEMKDIADNLLINSMEVIERMIDILAAMRAKRGRLFIAGVGGGAGTGSHSANDFMKIAGMATINLSDNASLLTALANDEGWESVFIRQLKMHGFQQKDCLFIYSVGGGSSTTSINLVHAIEYARSMKAPVLGIVGKGNGHAASYGTAVLVIPTVAEERITPHTESWQLAINHLLVNALAQIPIDQPVRLQEHVMQR